jgi:anti-sigma factor RsiW
MSADQHDLAGAYALEALPDLERARYERHLTSCDVCRAEVAVFLDVAAELGGAIEQAPPPGLRERVLAAVAAEAPESAPAPPPPAPAPAHAAVPAEVARPRRSRFAAPLAAAVAAAAVAVALTLVGVRLTQSPMSPTEERVLAILAAPDVSTSPLASQDQVRATVVAAPSADDAVVVVGDLGAEDGSWILWTVEDGQPVWQCPMEDPRDDSAIALVLDDVSGAEAVAVSLEPDANWVEAPRGPVVAQARLPGAPAGT